jgi:hypothetical protein
VNEDAAKELLHGDLREVREAVLILTETNRHAGHADILREQLDGSIGMAPGLGPERSAEVRAAHRAKVEQAARAADPDRA